MKNNQKKLIVLPGWGGSKKTWNEFIVLSKGHFDLKIIELPCFGNEPCPTNIWGVEEYAQFVIESLKDEKDYTLLGHSFGGQVASYIAANDLLPINKLILTGAACIRKPNSIKKSIIKGIAKCIKLFFSIFGLKKIFGLLKPLLYKLIGLSDYNEATGIKKEILKKVVTQDLSDILPNIKTKTLVIWGSKDSYVSVKAGKTIAKLIPNADIIIYDGARHGLHIDSTQKLIQDIKKFI